MSKTMEAIKMIADAFESHDGRAVEQAIFTISDARLLMDALSEGPRFKGQASLRPEGVAIEVTSAMEEAGMKMAKFQYNLPVTRASVFAIFNAMLDARSPQEKSSEEPK